MTALFEGPYRLIVSDEGGDYKQDNLNSFS